MFPRVFTSWHPVPIINLVRYQKELFGTSGTTLWNHSACITSRSSPTKSQRSLEWLRSFQMPSAEEMHHGVFSFRIFAVVYLGLCLQEELPGLRRATPIMSDFQTVS